jgi:hypothetical protein
LGENGQNLAAAPNEFAISNVIALVIGELQEKTYPIMREKLTFIFQTRVKK